MKIILCYREDNIGEAWRQYFSSDLDVDIVFGDICQVSCDAIVSPANSFGFMDGGLDYALSERFGWDLQTRLQAVIQERPLKELLIGEAVVLATEDAAIPWLISAPTMRVPMHIRTSVNAYLAMKAILCTAMSHSHDVPIRSVAIPGLGTGVGKLAPEVSANQMHQAYRETILDGHAYPEDFAVAQKQHLSLNRAGMICD